MTVDGVSLKEINDRAAESVGQDQTARMYRLILLCTIRNLDIQSRPSSQGFKKYSQVIPIKTISLSLSLEKKK